MTDRWTRLAPLTGIVFVAFIVAGPIALQGNTPGSDETGAKVIQFYRDHQHAQQLAGLLGVLGVVFLVFFVGYLRVLFRNAGLDGLAAVSFGGGILIAVGGATFSSLTFALADVPDKLDPSAAVALNVLNNDFFFPFVAGVAIFMLTNAVAIIRSRALPTWLGWVAVPVGVLAITPVGFIAFPAALAWILVASIVLSLRARRVRTPDAT